MRVNISEFFRTPKPKLFQLFQIVCAGLNAFEVAVLTPTTKATWAGENIRGRCISSNTTRRRKREKMSTTCSVKSTKADAINYACSGWTKVFSSSDRGRRLKNKSFWERICALIVGGSRTTVIKRTTKTFHPLNHVEYLLWNFWNRAELSKGPETMFEFSSTTKMLLSIPQSHQGYHCCTLMGVLSRLGGFVGLTYVLIDATRSSCAVLWQFWSCPKKQTVL